MSDPAVDAIWRQRARGGNLMHKDRRDLGHPFQGQRRPPDKQRRLSFILRSAVGLLHCLEKLGSGGDRIYRLYREEGLTVRKRRARRRAIGTRAPILVEAK